jgi:hypothetical protein
MFCASLALLVFAYGIAVGKYRIFPYRVLRAAANAAVAMKARLSSERSWLYLPTGESRRLPTYAPEAAYPGLNLVTAVAADNHLAAYIMDMEGRIIHSWDVDWFEVWPDAHHLPAKARPKEPPGTHIHGAVVLDDGDLVYNYEHLGLVRLDLCGGVVWRLPYRTHHSVELDDDGNLWVSAQINRTGSDARFPNHKPKFIEPMILQVSQDGRIKREISVLKLLRDNGLDGLLYLSTASNKTTTVTGDTVHLNDVEPFSSALQPGRFEPGDLLVSLRNSSAVLVFNVASGRVKQLWVGSFVRQHDPDFIDGNTISLFDNNNISVAEIGQQSRILLLSAGSEAPGVYFAGGAHAPFYSYLMGNHQWLPNGNLLITESMKGRAFEIDRDKRIVWEYLNLVGEGYAGVIEQVLRLPERMADVYSVANVSAKCSASRTRSAERAGLQSPASDREGK